MDCCAAVRTEARARMMPQNQQARTVQGLRAPSGRIEGQEPVDVRTPASRAPCCKSLAKTATAKTKAKSAYDDTDEVEFFQLVVLPPLSKLITFVIGLGIEECLDRIICGGGPE
jgi:hypothetical protein